MESKTVKPVTEIIEMPENQKYILCLLNSHGKPTKYVVFNGNSTPMTDEEIKQKLFDTHVASSSNYLSANLATKNAIREKFGVSGVQELEKAPFNPDAYLAKKEGPGTKYQTSTGNPFDIFDESKILAAFKTRKEDQVRLDEKWWESWRSAYGQGLAAMFGGLIALWIFSQAMGWIIRGFLGIPFGTDSKS